MSFGRRNLSLEAVWYFCTHSITISGRNCIWAYVGPGYASLYVYVRTTSFPEADHFFLFFLLTFNDSDAHAVKVIYWQCYLWLLITVVTFCCARDRCFQDDVLLFFIGLYIVSNQNIYGHENCKVSNPLVLYVHMRVHLCMHAFLRSRLIWREKRLTRKLWVHKTKLLHSGSSRVTSLACSRSDLWRIFRKFCLQKTVQLLVTLKK